MYCILYYEDEGQILECKQMIEQHLCSCQIIDMSNIGQLTDFVPMQHATINYIT
jgi:hypothetical protein